MDNSYFGAAPPPAPFLVAIFQVLFQMGSVALILVAINFVFETFSTDGLSAFLPWQTEKKTAKFIEVTKLQTLTQDVLREHGDSVIVVTMNQIALARCLPLSRKYAKDRLVFCNLDPLINLDDPAQISRGKCPETSEEEIIEYDLLAITERGKKWTGINLGQLEAKLKVATISKAEADLFPSNPVGLFADVLDAWLLRLLCGVIPWIGIDQKKIPFSQEK